MPVLICKNIGMEGPGTIEDYLKGHKIPYSIIDLSTSEQLPDPDGFDTLIMMGGPMSVNEDEIYQYIKEEEKLAAEFIPDRNGSGFPFGSVRLSNSRSPLKGKRRCVGFEFRYGYGCAVIENARRETA